MSTYSNWLQPALQNLLQRVVRFFVHHWPSCFLVLFLVPGSSCVEDALGDTIPPDPPVLRSLFNLVPADAHFPAIFLDDIFPVLSRSTWPPHETLGFPCKSLLRKSKVIHLWKMSKPSQTSASDNVFQLRKCSCLSDFLICYFVLPGNPRDTSLPCFMPPKPYSFDDDD